MCWPTGATRLGEGGRTVLNLEVDQFTVGFEKRPEDIERTRTEINIVSVAQQYPQVRKEPIPTDAGTPVVPEAIPGRLSR
jgi:hypothetical protein